MMNDSYLVHHGIKGQKWGVRRYRNYDGSYTRAGLKRYDASTKDYEDKKAAYKAHKKSGEYSKDALKLERGKVKQAKAKMNKDYKHLKQDYLGDKGKIRYANGERITNNGKIARYLTSAGGIAISAATYAYNNGYIKKKTATYIAALGGLTALGGNAYSLAKIRPNNELRAFYAHTSHY